MATTVGEEDRALRLPQGDGQVLSAPKRRLASRVPPTLGLAVVAGVLAMLFYLVATGSNEGVPVAVAARDIGAGERVDPAAVRFSEVTASSSVRSKLLQAKDLPAMRGFVTTHPIAAGSLLQRADLAPPAAPGQQRAMSFAVDAEHAVGGALRPGDRIDIVDGSDATYVVAGAEVLDVAKPSSSALATSRRVTITVAVDAQGALRLAAAIQNGKVEVVRSTGASPVPPSSGGAPSG